jgi:hypothetical protein
VSATVICGDWTDKRGQVHKGCGATLRWPDEKEKAAGLKRPLNPDGTAHNHDAPKAASPSTTGASSATTATNPPAQAQKVKEVGYYDGIQEIALETSVSIVNERLKAGWVILRIAERQGFTVAGGMPALSTTMASGPVMQVSDVCFILGRRAA